MSLLGIKSDNFFFFEMSDKTPLRSIPISNLQKETVKCRYCHKEVQYYALPIHEYNCGLTKPNRKQNYQNEQHN